MKRGLKVLKWLLLILMIIILFLVLIAAAGRFINSRKIKINTKNGVQESFMLQLGGIKQYIQIRGESRDNPVVIFLHGGPGSPMTFINYTYQLPLEKDYTFLSWDQRGCGRTYFANQNMNVDTELSMGILIKDLDELVDYARKRFNQDKVIILGHSWGTLLGSQYVQHHPEKVKAYVGVGQVVNGFKGYVLAAEEALKHAKEKNNLEDAEKLSSLVEKLSDVSRANDFRLKEVIEVQKYIHKYMPYKSMKSGLKQMWMGVTSPNFSLVDLKWYLVPNDLHRLAELQYPLFNEFNNLDLSRGSLQYKVPMYFISGESDWITPRVTAEAYYKKIEAPDKDMAVVKDSGHSPFIDQPEEFQKAVRNLLSRVK